MRTLIGSFSLFAAGVVVGIFLMQPSQAQQSSNPGLRLNHVGIYVKDFDESMRFYTQVMGFREAFTIKDKDGKPTLAYLQITRDTFLELAPATDDSQANLFASAEMGRVIFSAHAAESGSAEVATTASALADARQPATPVAVQQKSSDGAATHIQGPPVFPSGF